MSNVIAFINSTLDFFISIIDFITNFFENLFDFIKRIFVPSENFFSNNFNNLKDSFLSRFKFIEQINDVISTVKTNASTVDYEELRITFPKYNIDIDFSWYEPYRENIKNLLMGAFSLVFLAGLVRRNDPRINMGGS